MNNFNSLAICKICTSTKKLGIRLFEPPKGDAFDICEKCYWIYETIVNNERRKRKYNPIEFESNTLLLRVLKAAYRYYWLDDPDISDTEYDQLTKWLFIFKKNVTHPAKDLIEWDGLENCSSLHYIKRKDLEALFKND